MKSLIVDISTNEDKWKNWLSSKTPEISAIPDDIQSRLTPFEFLCLLRCARVDRITAATTQFISSTLGEQYVTPPIVNYDSIFNATSARTPVVFVLSPGADPAFDVLKLGEKKGFRLGKNWSLWRWDRVWDHEPPSLYHLLHARASGQCYRTAICCLHGLDHWRKY